MSTKWIISKKEKVGGRIWKAILIARGFTKNFEVSFKCEASTCSAEGLKVVLAVIKTFGWKVRALDIKTVNLQGREMMGEIYVR